MLIFTTLTKYIYILIIFTFLSFESFSQNRSAVAENPATAKLIKFYPNPASSVISFEFTKAYEASYSLQVYNFMGKKVYEIKKAPIRITINLEDFYRGVYIFQLRDNNGNIVQSGKFQVVK